MGGAASRVCRAACLYVHFNRRFFGGGNLHWGSREEVFRSGEARPLACMFISTAGSLAVVTFIGEVARRSFGLVRHDLWLQIDASVTSRELVTS
jgi:hypothetical protein